MLRKNYFTRLLVGMFLLNTAALAKGPGQVTITLEKPTKINGVPIAAGPVILYGEFDPPEKRTLAHGTLSQEFVTSGIRLLKGSQVSFSYNFNTSDLGNLTGFVSAADLAAFQLPIAGGHEVIITARLVSLTLAKDTRVLGFPALGGSSFSFVCRKNPCLNEDNAIERLGSLQLAQKHSINKIVFPVNSRLEFNANSGAVNTLYLPADQIFQGLPLSAGLRDGNDFIPIKIDLFGDGTIAGGDLTRVTSFSQPPVRLAPGRFELFQGGEVAGGILKEAATVRGIPLAPGWAHFDTYGNVTSGDLAEETEINGYELPKGTYIVLDSAQRILSLNFNRKLNLPVTFNGITFEHPLQAEFSKAGIVRQVEFAAPSRFGALLLTSRVIFDSLGHPLQIALAKEGVISGIRVKAFPALVSLHANGQLSTAQVPTGTKINGLIVLSHGNQAGGSDVSFFANGKPQSFSFVNPATIMRLPIAAKGGVGYYESGAVNWVSPLATNTLVQGIPAAQGSSVAFDDNGLVKYASKLSQDVTINGVHFKAGGEYRRP